MDRRFLPPHAPSDPQPSRAHARMDFPRAADARDPHAYGCRARLRDASERATGAGRACLRWDGDHALRSGPPWKIRVLCAFLIIYIMRLFTGRPDETI